jgi:hypothetical protein
MQEHTKPMTGSTRTWPGNYNFKCVDCHDPHGDANYYMVRSHISAPTTSTDSSFGSDSYGTPADTANASAVTFTSLTGLGAGSYGISGGVGICEVCHTQTNYWRRDIVSEGHVPGTRCTNCHSHTQGFAYPSCESCHDKTPYVQGAATAPNVMGDGNSLAGSGATPRPYDDGSYGYNVNGHGRDNDTSAISHGDPIAVECTGCHNIFQPLATHLDGALNGRLTPSDTRTANSFHLVPGFVNASPASDWSVQLTFDDYCWSAAGCHGGKTTDMRHAADGGNDPGWTGAPYVNPTAAFATQLGTHNSYDVPLLGGSPVPAPVPQMFYDRNLVNAAILGSYDGIPNWAVCISCHEPHGSNVVSPRADQNNKMMNYRWSTPSQLCVHCH